MSDATYLTPQQILALKTPEDFSKENPTNIEVNKRYAQGYENYRKQLPTIDNVNSSANARLKRQGIDTPSALPKALSTGMGSPIPAVSKVAPPTPIATPSEVLSEKAMNQGIEGSKLQADAETLKAQSDAKQATEFAKLEQSQKEERNRLFEEKKTKMKEQSQFAPTKENGQSLLALFGLMNVMAGMSGGSGKYAAMNAMANMTGAMKGYHEGKKELFDSELKQYEKNFQAIKYNNELQEKTYNEAMDLLSKNKDAGMAKIKELAALDNNGIVAIAARSGDLSRVSKIIQERSKFVQAIEHQHETMAEKKREFDQRATQHQAEMVQRRDIALAKEVAKYGDTAGYVAEKTGAHLDKKKADEVIQTAQAMGTMYSLIAKAKNDPDMVGRVGQAKGWIDKYIKSYLDTGNAPDDKESERDQKALLFAKQYAAALVKYERSLANGAKGFTVQFQNRFNELMKQTQFTTDGFVSLLENQNKEMANSVVGNSKALNIDNLSDMAVDIAERSGMPEAKDGLEFVRSRVNGKVTPSAPSSGETLTEDEKAELAALKAKYGK